MTISTHLTDLRGSEKESKKRESKKAKKRKRKRPKPKTHVSDDIDWLVGKKFWN